jgi:hypothetical protein
MLVFSEHSQNFASGKKPALIVIIANFLECGCMSVWLVYPHGMAHMCVVVWNSV